MVDTLQPSILPPENTPKEIDTFRDKTRAKLCQHWLEEIADYFHEESVSGFIRKIEDFIATGGGKSLAFDEIVNLSGPGNRLVLKQLSDALGLPFHLGTSRQEVPDHPELVYVQSAISSYSVSCWLEAKNDQALPSAELHLIAEKIRNSASLRWLEEFAKFTTTTTDVVTVAGTAIDLTKNSLSELSHLVAVLCGMNESDANELVNEYVEEKMVDQFVVNSKFKGCALHISLKDNNIVPLLVVQKESLYENNQTPLFCDSETCAQLVSGFSNVELMLSTRLEDAMMELGTTHMYHKRYGNGYADFTRKISEQVGYPLEKVVQQLFRGESVETARQKVAKLPDLNPTSPAGLAFQLLKQLLNPSDQGSSSKYELDLTLSMKRGSCKDAELFYARAAKHEALSGPIVIRRVGDFIIKENYGERSAMLIKDVILEGVTFPKGYLFQFDGKNKVRPLRPTAACFSETDARDAFGWQYAENYSSTNRAAIAAVIRHLLDPNEE